MSSLRRLLARHLWLTINALLSLILVGTIIGYLASAQSDGTGPSASPATPTATPTTGGGDGTLPPPVWPPPVDDPRYMKTPPPTPTYYPTLEWVSGPGTMGQKIQVAGKEIQLPSDAYYIDPLFMDTSGPGAYVNPPLYMIFRGDSRIIVTKKDGLIHSECAAQGEQGAFEFLWDALKEHNPERPLNRSWTACGPETAGSLIEVAGKMVQLPSDIWVSEILWQAQCIVDPCPIPPSYVLAHEHADGHWSTLAIDRYTGRISFEKAVPKGEAPFEALKEVME